MAPRVFTLFLLILAVGFNTIAADPEPIQDHCVADYSTISVAKVYGYACKSAAAAAADFYTKLLAVPGDTNNTMGSKVTAANVKKLPGLNTLGVSVSRIDYAVGGLNPPHTHPRATEVVFVLEGVLDVGFITTENVLISKTITKGEVFVFPKGLVHYQKNGGDTAAAVISAFNSQLPGSQYIGATLFATKPAVPECVLAKAFQVGSKEVEEIKNKFCPPNYKY